MSNLFRRAAVLAALAVAACDMTPAQPPPLAIPAAELPRFSGPHGVDLATDASDVINELRTSRLDFVARYYRDPASRWPALTPREARRLSALGLNIVTVWESHSGTVGYFSYASGYNDALSAYRQAYAVGQPVGSAIYFAVDFNAGPSQLYYIDQYFRGINAGLYSASRGRPAFRVGVYGSGYICDAMRRARLAQYSWLSNSTAWAGSQSYAGWNIRQHGPLATLSFNHDFNDARADYGGFRVVN